MPARLRGPLVTRDWLQAMALTGLLGVIGALALLAASLIHALLVDP